MKVKFHFVQSTSTTNLLVESDTDRILGYIEREGQYTLMVPTRRGTYKRRGGQYTSLGGAQKGLLRWLDIDFVETDK